MKLRSATLLLTVWALTVVGVSAVTWQVIHTAGQGVLDASSAGTPSSTATAAPPSPTADHVRQPARGHGGSTHPARPGGATAGASPTPSSPPPTAAPGPTAPTHHAPSPSPTVPTASAPGHGDGHGGGSGGGHHGGHHGGQVNPSPPPTPPTPPAVTVDSWRGAAGVVTVSCEPGRVRLLGASPADGYRLEVEQEDDEVQVHFEREHPSDEVQVRARCVNGTPRFDVETEDRPQQDSPSDPPSEPVIP